MRRMRAREPVSTPRHGLGLGGIEQCDNVGSLCDVSAEQIERFFHMEAKARFIDRYCRFDGCVALRRSEYDARSEPVQDGFIIERSRMGFDSPAEQRNPLAGSGWRHREQAIMLSHDVELVERMEKTVRSWIWPCRFDRLDLGIRKPAFSFDLFCGVTPPIVGAPRNWEMRMVARCVVTVPLNERPHENVQTAADRMDYDARINLNSRIERRFDAHHYKLATSLRVRLGAESILGNDAAMPGVSLA